MIHWAFWRRRGPKPPPREARVRRAVAEAQPAIEMAERIVGRAPGGPIEGALRGVPRRDHGRPAGMGR